MPTQMPIRYAIFAGCFFGLQAFLSICNVHCSAEEPMAIQEDSFLQVRWPDFRGPNADGISPSSGQTPTHWLENSTESSAPSPVSPDGIVWKLPTEGLGWSTPAVWDGTAWFTSASVDGSTMWTTAVDLKTGNVSWKTDLFENESVDEKHAMNSFASPSPVTDGEHVWVHFGSYGTACIKADSGQVVWTRRDLPCNHWRGPGSSPILLGDKLIVHYDGFDFQYVIAFDAQTGRTVWKVDRDIDYGTDNGDFFKAFSTPLVIDVNGQQQLISPTSKAVIAYDPKNGKEIWRVRFDEFSATARPLWDGKTLFINTGFGKANLYAIDPRDGKGDLTDSSVLWINSESIGSKSSQLLLDGLIYNVHDSGVATCIDAQTGETLWKERLGGKFSASILHAGGNVYLFDHDGASYVIKPGREYKPVSVNQLDDGCMASPVPLGDHLLVRTRSAIYLLSNHE
jgi:outer membrane protein assembly factor BamB